MDDLLSPRVLDETHRLCIPCGSPRGCAHRCCGKVSFPSRGSRLRLRSNNLENSSSTMGFPLLINSEVDDSEYDADDEAEDGGDGFSRLGSF